MSPPGVFRIILLALAIQCSHQQEADCTYSNNCDTSANVAKISCLSNHFGVVVDCTCEDEDAGVSCGEVGDLAGVTDIDDALCIAYCEASVLSCMFWKLTDRGGTKICYLMDQDQCQAKDSSDECPEFNSQGEQECWGGNVDGTAGKPTCQDGTDSGGGSSCPGPITTFAENPTKFYQKWKCFDNTKITEVNMYEENAEMPLGGYCLLDEDNGGSCKPTDTDFKFICQRDEADNSIKWTKGSDAIDDTDILGPEGQLQDVECGAPALVFTDAGKPTQGGRDIYCINGGLTEESGTTQSQTEAPTPAPGRLRFATAGIPAENDCLMTCDDYSVLQFYTDYNRDGEVGRGWFFEIVGFQMDPVRMDNADILDCWG